MSTTGNSIAPKAGVLLRFYQAEYLSTEITGDRSVTLMRHGQRPLAQRDNDSTSALLGFDRQHSILLVQQALELPLLTYNPYGHHSGSPTINILAFTGQRCEVLTRHYLLGNGHRAFSSALMKFLSPDNLSPFGTGGLNAYAYCRNDPINQEDPSGKSPFKTLLKGFKEYIAPKGQIASESMDLSARSLIRRSFSEPEYLDGRALINDFGKKLSFSTPFVDKLTTVNTNLASHGDRSLSPTHATAYIKIGERTRTGSISNTTAHLLASEQWLTTEQGAPRIVGAAFNGLGAVGAGVEDHALLKTGRAFNLRARDVRQP